MKYRVERTDSADRDLKRIVTYIARNFGIEKALYKLDRIEPDISKLEDNPYIGVEPGNAALRRRGYRILILEKDLAFYKVDETQKRVLVLAVVDQRQDYLSIVNRL